MVFRDLDSDGFGDPIQSKSLDCKKEGIELKDYLPPYYEEKGEKTVVKFNKDGWVANRWDLSDISPTLNNMPKNIFGHPGRSFVVHDDTSNTSMICSYVGSGVIECLQDRAFQDLCLMSSSYYGIFARLARLKAEHVTNMTKVGYSKSAMLGCLAGTENQATKWYHHGQDLYLMATFSPLGRILLAVNGSDYFIPMPDTSPEKIIASGISRLIEDEFWPLVAPHVINSLKDIEGPIPIGAAEDLPYVGPDTGKVKVTRRILAGGMIGPVFHEEVDATMIKNNGLVFTDLFANPLIYAYQEDLKKLVETTDQDGDYLTDLFEIGQGLDPRNGDSDGDGIGDAMEYLWARHNPAPALNPSIMPKLTSIEYPKKNLVGVDLPMTTDELVIFSEAKMKAIQLVPMMMKRLHELYDVQSEIVQIDDGVDIVGLINKAQNGTRLALYENLDLYGYEPMAWSQLFDGSYRQNVSVKTISPFLFASDFLFGISSGCGPTGEDICIDLTVLKQGGPTINFEKLVNTLLHEALHHVVSITLNKDDWIEHRVIYDTIGQLDYSNLI